MKNYLIIRSLFLTALLLCFNQARSQWQFIGSPESCKSIDFDNEGDTLLVLTTSGLFYSTDIGISWQAITIPQECIALEDAQIERGSLYVTTSYHVFVDTLQRTKYDVYRSDDWGTNWHLITPDLDSLAFFIQVLVKADTFYFIDHSAIYVSYDKGDHYVMTMDNLGTYSHYYIHHHRLFGQVSLENSNGLLRSDDDGQSWDTLYTTGSGLYIADINSIDDVLWKIEHYPEFHICRIQKSLDDGDTWITTATINDLLVGFFDNDPKKIIGGAGQLYVETHGYYGQLYYSDDGGMTWIKPPTYSDDKEAFFAGDKLFFSANNGLYSSVDNGMTIDQVSKGLESAIVKNIATSNADIWIQANHMEYSLRQGSQVWQALPDFEDVESTRDGHLLGLKHNYEFYWPVSEAYISSDGGHEWKLVTGPDLSLEPGSTADILYIMCAGDIMYISDTHYQLFYSTDYGVHWHKTNLSYGYSLNYNDKYLIELDGNVIVSDDGFHWDTLPKPEHPDLHFSIDFVYWMDPYYFVGSNNLLLRLHKDSTTWEEIVEPYSDVIDYPLSMISHNDVLFLSVFGLGVFASTDFGQSLYPVNEGLTNFRGITLSKDEDYLYFGVDGGVWKRKLSDMVVATKDPERSVHSNSSSYIVKDVFHINVPEATHYSYQLYSSDGKILLHKTIDSSSGDIDLDKFPAGLYYLNIVAPQYHDVRRILKI